MKTGPWLACRAHLAACVAIGVSVGILAGCGGGAPVFRRATPRDVLVTEIASVTAGGGDSAARDERGDYEDWIELFNPGEEGVDLAGLVVSDRLESPSRWRLPADEVIPLAAKGYRLLFADGEPEQGATHLPFKLSREGESLSVRTALGEPITALSIPPMRAGQSLALSEDDYRVCDTPTPGRANACVDASPPSRHAYAPYAWPTPYPPPLAGPVVISEVDPFGDVLASGLPYIELVNISSVPVLLDGFRLSLAVLTPPEPLPTAPNGAVLPLSGRLAPGETMVLEVPSVSPASSVVTLFDEQGRLVDRVAIEDQQAGTILQLPPDRSHLHLGCDAVGATPGALNRACVEPPPRARAPRMVRALRSRADFDAMALGIRETSSDARAVNFVIDRQNGDAMYFVDSGTWDLHFDWVWEVIEGGPHLDRCLPRDRQRHLAEWNRFSRENYFVVEGRRYMLGALVHYADSDLFTIELAAGDLISSPMIESLFFTVASNVWLGPRLAFRPTTARLESLALGLEGHVPMVGLTRPFEGQRLETLNATVGYGLLERVDAASVETAPISYQTIALFDRIPSELPPVAGTITEEFQTPLAHVNVLAQNRGTPNMALIDARHDPRIAPYIGQLVRLEVEVGRFSVTPASREEAEAFWARRRETRPTIAPPRDLSVRGIVDLSHAAFSSVGVVGAKAAAFAELMALDWPRWSGGLTSACALSGVLERLPVPRPAFAIPFERYVEHLERNGIDREIETFLASPGIMSDPALRRRGLEEIRARIEAAPIDPELLDEVSRVVGAKFGHARVRFRSSTNVEDLPGFNGAGLYASYSGQLESDARPIDRAIKKTWASLWSFRGFEERTLFGVEPMAALMAVLIHAGFPGEEANGVAITRNVVAPDSHGFYVNAQLGEIPVVSSATGVLPEQLLYKLFSPPEIVVLGRSSLAGDAAVLTPRELHRLACVLGAIHNRFAEHFQDRIPLERFASDVEWKLVGERRDLVIKQARPWTEGGRIEPTRCR